MGGILISISKNRAFWGGKYPVRMGQTGRAGFTLIEMLIALTIFSIGMLAIINMFTTGFAASRSVRTLNTATRLAQKMMETMTVDLYNYTNGMNAIINTAMSESGVVIESSSNPLRLKWPDSSNSDFKYTVTVSVTGYDISNAVTVNMAEARVEWTEMNTAKMVNVVTFLP